MANVGIERFLADSLDEALIGTSLDGTVTLWNRTAEALYGWQASEAIGRNITDLTAIPTSTESAGQIIDALCRGESWSGDFLVRRKDETTFLANIRALPVRDESGALIGILGVSRDVTATRAREHALTAERGVQGLALDAAPALIGVASMAHPNRPDWIYLNDQWEEYTGWAREELRRAGQAPIIHPDDLDESRAAGLREKFIAGEPFEYEMRLRNAEGQFRWHLFRYRPVFDAAGRLALSLLAGFDIHRFREGQQRAETEAAIARRLADAIPALVTGSTVDANGAVTPVFFNAHWREFSGLTEEELLGDKRAQVFRPQAWARIEQLRHDAATTGPAEGEMEYRNKHGQYRWHRFIHRPLEIEGGWVRLYITIAVDIHARKMAEEASARLAAIVDSSSDAIVGKTLDGIITSWNGGAERLYGYTAAEAIGRHINLVVPEDLRGEQARLLERLAAGGSIEPFETMRRTRDGRLIAVDLTLSPIRDAAGNVAGASASARDITERKRLLEDLRIASAVKDEFLGLVSHELRTPLTAIVGLQRQLRRHLGLAEAATGAILDDLTHYAERLQGTVENMLLLTRLDREAVEMEPVLLQRLLAAAVADHQARYPNRALDLHVEPTVPPVEGHPGWMRQVLENLLSNAEKYSPAGAPVTVEAGFDGQAVRLSVSDRGPGVGPEEAGRIFEPFYRLGATADKPGAGLGLAVCQRLVELQGGTISVCPREGGGAVFQVRLPALAAGPDV